MILIALLINIAAKIKGTPRPIAYNAINIELLANEASCAANDNIVPSMGPIHGVQPNANARPKRYAPKKEPP